MQRIVVDILSDGEVKIETKGYSGPACLEESKFLTNLLGKETASQLTPAYYSQGKNVVKKHLPLCG